METVECQTLKELESFFDGLAPGVLFRGQTKEYLHADGGPDIRTSFDWHGWRTKFGHESGFRYRADFHELYGKRHLLPAPSPVGLWLCRVLQATANVIRRHDPLLETPELTDAWRL